MKKLSVRQRILETACRLFYQQGYQATGINQIIAEADIAKSSLYQHFASKDDLCVAYLETSSRAWFDHLQIRLETASTAYQKLNICFTFLAEDSISNQFRGCHFLNIMAEVADPQSEVVVKARQHKQQLRSLFQRITADLSTEISRSEPLADSIYLLFEGALIESQVQKDAWPIQVAQATMNKLAT